MSIRAKENKYRLIKELILPSVTLVTIFVLIGTLFINVNKLDSLIAQLDSTNGGVDNLTQILKDFESVTE